MMPTPFEPLGPKARWRIIYDLLQRKHVDDRVTYVELGALLDLNPDDERHTIQMSMRRAAQEYEREDKRALESIPNVGYRVVHAREHLQLARRQQKRANRSLERGHSKVVNVDFNDVDPETRKAFEVVARAFAMQMDFNRRFDTRQKRLEDVVETVSQRTERTESELRAMRERLARLEGEA